jgi:hypothetical protein
MLRPDVAIAIGLGYQDLVVVCSPDGTRIILA